jgi:hypothetical protein
MIVAWLRSISEPYLALRNSLILNITHSMHKDTCHALLATKSNLCNPFLEVCDKQIEQIVSRSKY